MQQRAAVVFKLPVDHAAQQAVERLADLPAAQAAGDEVVAVDAKLLHRAAEARGFQAARLGLGFVQRLQPRGAELRRVGGAVGGRVGGEGG